MYILSQYFKMCVVYKTAQLFILFSKNKLENKLCDIICMEHQESSMGQVIPWARDNSGQVQQKGQLPGEVHNEIERLCLVTSLFHISCGYWWVAVHTSQHQLMAPQKAQGQNQWKETLNGNFLAVLSIRTLDTEVTKQKICLYCFCVFWPVLYPKALISPGCHNLSPPASSLS